MDTVKSFNAELSSLYDVKPPISKAKMTAITKGAIKAVKFYKHVVQSVEKFLQKCRPEYKIPGLYVIDSIVRQSRHQFGTDKDVFAPRFSKNINFTFYFIYQCTNEEKSKVIRVLNLWQRNSVFPPEVIQPLFDMADSNHPKYKEVEAQMLGAKGPASSGSSLSKTSLSAAGNSQDNSGNLNGSLGRDASMGGFEDASEDSNNQSQPLIMGNLPNLSSTEMSLATRLQHLQHLFGQEPGGNAAPAAPTSQAKASATANSNPDTGQIRFNKKLLDFDYDDEDDEPNQQQQHQQQQQLAADKARESAQQQQQMSQPGAVDALGNLLTNPDILRHLQSLQQQISAPAGLPAMLNSAVMGGQPPPPSADTSNGTSAEAKGVDAMHHAALAPFGGVDFTQPPPGFTPLTMRLPHLALGAPLGLHGMPPAVAGLPPPHPGSVAFPPAPPLPPQQQPPSGGLDGRREDFYPPNNNNNNGDTNDGEHNRIRDRDRRRSRSRSGSRNRGSGRGRHRKSRSRSRSRDRDRRSRRTSRSRSRTRSPGRNRRRRSRSKEREEREKERLEREKERDRKRKGLPPLRKEHLSVCSTTLWVGHLSKLVQQEELSDTFGQYGEIVSIDLIPPRGCAFVCMHRRQDAYRALNKLAGHKLQGKAITVAWAPGKGVKAKEWKDYWEVEQGVSYIPWSKLSNLIDFDTLEEGGSFDEESLPAWMRNNENHAVDGGAVVGGGVAAMQLVPAAPGFIPIPETVNAGPPTPETAPDSQNLPAAVAAVAAAAAPGAMGAVSSAGLTTTLPPNLPTYAMAPLGLLPGTGLVPAMSLGALRLAGPPPGLLVPPHHPAGANMPNLLGQPILAGLGPSLVPQLNLQGPQAPAGFFGVFPPAPAASNPAGSNNNQIDEDDMELEEAEEDVHKDSGHHHGHQPHHHHGHPHHTPHKSSDNAEDQRLWDADGDGSDREQPPHGPRHGAKASAPGAPGAPSSGLLERLRSLANCDGPPPPPPPPGFRPHFEADGQHVNGEDRRPPAGSLMVRTDLGGLSLASALRGAPLTSGAAVQELGIRLAAQFGVRTSAPEPFSPTHRHTPGGQHGGAPLPFANAAAGFTPLRGPPPGLNASPGPRMGLANNRGRGRGFRLLDGTDGDRRPPHWPDEEMRGGWRDRGGAGDDDRFRPEGHADWSVEGRDFGERGGERHGWRTGGDQRADVDRDRRGGGRDWGNRRPPRGDRDRGGGGRDRFGRDRDSRGPPERRGRSGERERERDNRRDRRGGSGAGGRWGPRRSPSREKTSESGADGPPRDAESADPGAEVSHHHPKSPPPPPEECDAPETSAPHSDHRPPEPPPVDEPADGPPPVENTPTAPLPPTDGVEGAE